MKRFSFCTLLASLAIIQILTACNNSTSQHAKEQAIPVEVYRPTALQTKGIVTSGTVTARQTAQLSTRFLGFVNRIYVQQGDQVKAGQLLISLQSNDLQAKKAQAEAMLIQAQTAASHAQRDYERFQSLHTQQSVSDKELENMALHYTSANAQLQVAAQSLNEIKAQLTYTDIRAPFNGVVTRRMIDEGSTATPGQPLLILEQTGQLYIESSVTEADVASIRKGMKVNIDIPSQKMQLEGVLTEISPSSASNGGQYGIKVSLPSSIHLHAGMYASLFLPTESSVQSNETPSLWIDLSSVVRRDQLTGVYLATPDQYAQLRWIRLGKQSGHQVEVLSGLKSHENIIRKSQGKLYNGVPIQVSQPK